MLRIIEEVSRHLWAMSNSGIDALASIVSSGEEDVENNFFKGSTIREAGST